jgi:hypothetical protein
MGRCATASAVTHAAGTNQKRTVVEKPDEQAARLAAKLQAKEARKAARQAAKLRDKEARDAAKQKAKLREKAARDAAEYDAAARMALTPHV